MSLAAQILAAIIGVWLMVAPYVLQYGGDAATNDRIVGPLIVSFAIIAMSEVTFPLRRINQALGLWLLIAPWILDYAATDTLNSMLCGLAVMAASTVRRAKKQRIGGGWISLLQRR